MFDQINPDVIVACLIVLAYFGGALMGLGVAWYFESKEDQKPVRPVSTHRPKMEINEDMEAVAQAVNVIS